MRPFWALRYFIFFGESISNYLLRPDPRSRRRLTVHRVEHFTAENPHFDADQTIGRQGFRKVVIDVRSQSMERHAAFHIALGPRHVGAAETARALDLNAFRAGLHGLRDGFLHG